MKQVGAAASALAVASVLALVCATAVVVLALLKTVRRGASKHKPDELSGRLGWVAQLVLGVSLAVTALSALTLIDNNWGTYLVVLVATLATCLLGLLLRRNVAYLAFLSAGIAGVSYALTMARPWLVGVVALIVGLTLLWAPTSLSRRAGRAWARVASTLAVTCVAIAVTFYARAAPVTYLALAVKTAHGESGPEMVYLNATIQFAGCGNPVSAKVYWGVPPYRVTPQTPSKALARILAFSDTEAVLAATGKSAFPIVQFSDIGLYATGNPVESAPALRLLRPVSRGIGSCYLVVPSLVGPSLVGHPIRFSPTGQPDALPLKAAENDLFLNGAGLSVVRGSPPTSAGDPSRWQCNSAGEFSVLANTLPLGVQPPTKPSLGGDCGAVVMLTEPWYQTFQNVMLLVIGALFALLAGLVISATGIPAGPEHSIK